MIRIASTGKAPKAHGFLGLTNISETTKAELLAKVTGEVIELVHDSDPARSYTQFDMKEMPDSDIEAVVIPEAPAHACEYDNADCDGCEFETSGLTPAQWYKQKETR